MANSAEKPLMVVGIDNSEQSNYALQWTLDHFFTPFLPNPPFKLLLVYAKATPNSTIRLAGPGNLTFTLLNSLYYI